MLLGLLSLVVVLMSAGCATAINGTTQHISFSSEPPGATVIIDGNSVGTTPVTVPLSRHDNHAVRIEKTGYVPYETTTATAIDDSNWGLLNVLPAIVFPPALLIELLFDYHYGGSYKIEPQEVSAHLLPAPARVSANVVRVVTPGKK